MQLIAKMKFGSHLYGTNTEHSDTDYKGVGLIPPRDILLNHVMKSNHTSTKQGDGKNSNQDIDIEIYSLHYFIELALMGETVAFDMLHAPLANLIIRTPLWEKIVSERNRFYSKNMKAFVGYARRQAAKYGVKGSRIAAAEKVIKVLQENISEDDNQRLSSIWDILPEEEHLVKDAGQSPRIYSVCGRMIQDTVKIQYALYVLHSFVNAYGHRAQLAKENQGVDWKAVSHAFRAAFQLKSMFIYETIIFPLPEADFLKMIKYGHKPYAEVGPMLDDLITEVEALANLSTLPERPDRQYWDDFLEDATWDSLKQYHGILAG